MKRLPRWLRATLIALGAIVALAVVIRLVLDPIAAHYTRKGLAESEDVRGDFQGVHVTVLPPGYAISRLKIVEREHPDWRHPLFYAERVRVVLVPGDLLHRRITARVRLDEPKVIVTARPTPAKKPEKPFVPPDIDGALRRVLPARVDRVEVRGGELLFRDLAAPRHPEIWLHDVEIAAENLATRPELTHGEPATVSLSGKLGKTGKASLFVSADLFAHRLDLAGEMGVRGWRVAELYDLVQPATKLQTPEGTLDVYARWRVRGDRITGGVKPELKNVEVRPTEDSFGNKLKAWIADKGLEIFSDRVPGRNAAVTVIPIEGRLDKPDAQIFPTVLGIVRNAFVEGISGGFAHLPPPTAEKKEGVLEQTKRALDDDRNGPPAAQPTNEGTKR